MLDTEVALATAQAEVGVVASSAAEEIRRVGRVEQFDITALGHAAVASGTPVLPMLERFRALLTPEAADALHFGATSQDILDTAAMLITRPVLDAIQRDLRRAATACPSLAEAHRASVMLGRTLLQPAVPTTFGLKAAGWLVAIIEARRGIGRVRDERLAVQFGGAVGTLAAGGPGALAVVSWMAELLGMAEPSLPWHSHRARIAELGSGLAVATGALGKIALDVILLAQAEVGEVVEGGAGAGSDGRSSAMPQKRNPVMAVAIRANALRLPGLAATLFAAMAQEHERAAGAWQAEWPVIRDALALTAGAASRAALLIEGLEVRRTDALESPGRRWLRVRRTPQYRTQRQAWTRRCGWGGDHGGSARERRANHPPRGGRA